MLAFTRGIEGGFGGWEGNEYTGPYGETTIDYTYGDGNGDLPHAVTARSNGDAFSYDDNGNMTSRTQGGVTWTQVFDAENRLVSVSNNATPTTTTTYVYDGSGGRLKRIESAGGTITTTLYVAGMEIETVEGGEAPPPEKRTIYYPSGGAFRIISGENSELYYRHSDHLGSTSVLSDDEGMKVAKSDVVYAPFGEVRSGEQSNLTDFGYTGQKIDESTGGLMYYGARYYLPGLMRFISADTIVPGPSNPQAFNRYSYVLNNPLNMVDPTGHVPCPYYPNPWPAPAPQPWPPYHPNPWPSTPTIGGSGGGGGGGGNCPSGMDAGGCNWMNTNNATVPGLGSAYTPYVPTVKDEMYQIVQGYIEQNTPWNELPSSVQDFLTDYGVDEDIWQDEHVITPGGGGIIQGTGGSGGLALSGGGVITLGRSSFPPWLGWTLLGIAAGDLIFQALSTDMVPPLGSIQMTKYTDKDFDRVVGEYGLYGLDKNRFSEHLHDQKTRGNYGTKNERGDFTLDELRELAEWFLDENKPGWDKEEMDEEEMDEEDGG